MYDVIIDVKQGDPQARPDPHATSSLAQHMRVEADDEMEAEQIARGSIFEPIFDTD